jgi:hypothetical protein
MHLSSFIPVLLTTLLPSCPAYLPEPATHEPICLPAAEVRSSFAVEPPHAIETFGKIAVQGKFLLVSEPYKGLHVLDNSSPAAPKALGFLRILGNTELAMLGDILYANSSTDLLTIRLTTQDGVQTAELVNRVENALSVITPADFENDETTVRPSAIKRCSAEGGMVVGFRDRVDGDVTQTKIEENRRD